MGTFATIKCNYPLPSRYKHYQDCVFQTRDLWDNNKYGNVNYIIAEDGMLSRKGMRRTDCDQFVHIPITQTVEFYGMIVTIGIEYFTCKFVDGHIRGKIKHKNRLTFGKDMI